MLNAMTIRSVAPAVVSLMLVASAARAQQPASVATAPATPGWYSYVPGQGWVGYSPASAPPAASIAPAAPAPPAANVAPGWYGYAPASAWAGYAPASGGSAPAVRMQPRNFVYPYGPQRRWAANQAVNGNRPDLVYTLPSYREYGTGRQVPLAKPWLPR